MYDFKIYSGDHEIINDVAHAYNKNTDLIKDGQAYGYVCVDDVLRPFCESSQVDMDNGIPDVTNLFIKNNFKL